MEACHSLGNPSTRQVTERRQDLHHRQVRAQQDQHLCEGLSEGWQRCDLHVSHRVLQRHRQDDHPSCSGNR